ncbi:MAG: TIGR03435 family protein [Acidobacteriaceae bacterium]
MDHYFRSSRNKQSVFWTTIRFATVLSLAGLSQPNQLSAQAVATTSNGPVNVPVFEVAVIKPGNPNTLGAKLMPTPRGIAYTNEPLPTLIRVAYGFGSPSDESLILNLPSWAKKQRFDIEANVSESNLQALHKMTETQHYLMLQPLLVDRFKLKAHWESRAMPAYNLVVVTNGLKLTEFVRPTASNEGDVPHTQEGLLQMRRRGHLEATGVTIPYLIAWLGQSNLGRPVVDATSLHCEYNFTLDWAPDDPALTTSSAPHSSAASDPSSAASGPSIFTALKDQLGLELRPIKSVIPVLVIDHIEEPSEN